MKMLTAGEVNAGYAAMYAAANAAGHTDYRFLGDDVRMAAWFDGISAHRAAIAATAPGSAERISVLAGADREARESHAAAVAAHRAARGY